MPNPVHRSLGSRLEEARKRKGVSLREAGEATKIRTEYLSRFEEGDFDIPLPGIYQRGFAKIYANYLGEDAEEIVAEVQALLQQGRSSASSGEPRVSFGQLDLGTRRNKELTAANRRRSRSLPAAPGAESARVEVDEDEEEAPAEGGPRFRLPQWAQRRGKTSAGEWEEEEEWDRPPGPDRGFYLKVVAIIGSVTVAIILLFALVKVFTGAPASSGETESAVVAGSDSSAGTPAEAPAAAGAGGSGGTLTLRATDGTTWIRVNDAASGEVLLRTSLEPGATESVEVDGEALILFTQGENLEVERGGEIFAPSRSGPGKIRIE